MSSRRWRTRRRASAHAALGSGRAAVTLATLAVMVNSVPLPSQPTRLHVSGRRLCHLRLPRRVTSGCLAELRAKVDVNREVAVKSRTPRAQCGYPGKSGSGLELPAGAASRYDAVTRVRW